MAAKGQPPSPDYVPAAPIRRIVGEVLERREFEYDKSDGDNQVGSGKIGPVASIAFDVWGGDDDFHEAKGLRALGRLLSEQEFVHFDRADKILCGLGLFMLWHDDPELNAIWNSGVVAETDAREARLAAQAAA